LHIGFIENHKEHVVHYLSKEVLLYLEQWHVVYRPRNVKFFKHYMNTVIHALNEKGLGS